MPAVCLTRGLANIFAPLLMAVLVVNAFALMTSLVKGGEALRNIAIALCLFAVLAVLVVMLLQIWLDLTILQKIGLAIVGLALLLRVASHRARQKPNLKDGH